MTTYLNDASGGTAGVTVTPANSGGASGQAWSAVNGVSGGGTVQYSSAQQIGSPLAYLMQTAAGGSLANLRWNFPSMPALTYVRLLLYYPALPASGDWRVYSWETASGNCASIHILSTGQLNIRDSTSATMVTTTATVTPGKWFRIEAWCDTGLASTGQAELRYFAGPLDLDPAEDDLSAATFNTGASQAVDFDFGIEVSTSGAGPWYQACLGLSGDGWIGPPSGYSYRLADGLSGRPGVGSSGTQPPASAAAATGGWLLGTIFTLTAGMRWLEGYWFWVPPGGDTSPAGGFKFCTWDMYGTAAGVVVPGSVVSIATLTAGQMNYVPLATPLQLAPGEVYMAAMGYTAAVGIPLTAEQFGSGQAYAAGIPNGPLFGWPDVNSAANPYPWANAAVGQGLFSNSLGSDPTVNFPNNASNYDFFWIDPQVSDSPPDGYAGTFRLRPNAYGLGSTMNTGPDTANNFTLGVEFSLSETCSISKIWFYSPSGLTQLPTAIGVYTAAGVLAASNYAPAWSGAAGSGWVSAALSGNLPAGEYKACVCNGAASPAIWNNSIANFWNPGGGANGGWGGAGLTAGPLSYPNTANATSPGQASYNPGAALTFPATNIGPYDYGVDIELSAGAAAAAAAASPAGARDEPWMLRFTPRWA